MKSKIYIFLTSLISVFYLSQNPIAKWDFNGNANDSSGYSNNLTVYNATLTKDRFDNENSAYYFNGTNAYLEGIVQSLPAGNASRTITGWFRSDYNSGDGFNFTICDYGSQSAALQRLGLDIYNKGYLEVYYSWQTISYYVNDNNYINNSWYFFALTYDGTNLRLYTNGTLAKLNGADSVFAVNLDTKADDKMFRIGQKTGVQFQNFKGSIDDIAIYNTVLNATEISALYHENLLTKENSMSENIKIYPNPAKDFVTVDHLSKNATVKITDATGKLMNTSTVTDSKHKFNISNFANGIYFIEVNDNGKISNKKFIVRK